MEGLKWCNPYNLGPVRNWQETFDAHGWAWWLTWMLPNLKKKRGNGWQLPRAKQRTQLPGSDGVAMLPLS
jgi:hypothetical protein